MTETQRTPIDRIKPGAVLDEAVQHRGRTLFAPGRKLSSADIDQLKQLPLTEIAVRNDGPRFGDKVQGDPLSTELRRQAISTVRSVYQDFKNLDRKHGRAIHSLGLRLHDEVRNATHLGVAVHDLRDHSNYTFQHSVNVTAISLAIGIRMGLSHDDLNLLTVGGLLHDIGKMRIPLEILEKHGKLTPEEVKLVRMHPVWGWELLKEQPEFDPVIWSIARQHHETMDGQGYPDGLMGWKIHELSRIVTVVDMWDALRSERPYKAAWHPDKVLNFLNSPQMAAKLDPQVLEIFNTLIVPYPIGSRVMISGGRTAKVVGLNLTDYARPILRFEPEGVNGYFDLLEHKAVNVIETLEVAA